MGEEVKPVFQKRFGLGRGDCLNAAVASVLERTLASIPDFAAAEGGQWFELLYQWCKAEEIGLICFQPSEVPSVIMANFYCILIHEVVGVSQEDHAIVGHMKRGPSKDGRFEWECNEAHDPARGRNKLGELVHIIVLIPAPAAQPRSTTDGGVGTQQNANHEAGNL